MTKQFSHETQKIVDAFDVEYYQKAKNRYDALAAVLRELVVQLQYDNTDWQAPNEQMIMDVERVMLVADELEGK